MIEIKTTEAENITQETKEVLESWKKQEVDCLNLGDQKLNVVNHLISALLSSSDVYSLVVHGGGGVGKTLSTLSAIKKNVKDDGWAYVNGFLTPLALYEWIYKNKDKEVIVFDDVEGLFNNNYSVAILKGALWETNGSRICQYNSTSEKLTVAPVCIVKAKVIILANEIPSKQGLGLSALFSRAMNYNLEFTYKEKLRLIEKYLAKEDQLTNKEKHLVWELIEQNTNEATKDFNFRTLRKAISLIKYNAKEAKKLFLATTEIDEVKFAYFEAIKATKIVKEQIKIFIEKTGMHRATFFRIKKEVAKSQKK